MITEGMMVSELKPAETNDFKKSRRVLLHSLIPAESAETYVSTATPLAPVSMATNINTQRTGSSSTDSSSAVLSFLKAKEVPQKSAAGV